MSHPELPERSASIDNTSVSGPSGQARGAFIVFEGLDRSGKTTQSTKLYEHLIATGVPARQLRFPDRTTATGVIIDKYLSSTEPKNDRFIHQIFAANRSEKSEEIVKMLRLGETLIVDRYAYSGVAYTSAKEIPGLDFRWCKCVDEGLPAPDAVFYMQTSPATLATRAGYGEERYEKVEFQQKVKRWFEELEAPNWKKINADQPVDTIHAEIVHAALDVISSCKQGVAVRRLWDLSPY